MRFLLIISVFIFSTFECYTQETDSTNNKKFFPKYYGEKKWRFILGLDAKRSFYAGYPVKINGIRTGAEYLGVHRFGLGTYWMRDNLEFTDINVDQPDANDTTIVKFKVSYASLFYERVFFKTRKWELALPFYLGGGSVRGLYYDTTSHFKEFVEKPFSSISAGVQCKYYIWSWLAPKVSIGYRLTFNAEKEIKQAFNAPYYAFGISISLGELYRAIFKNDEPRKRIRAEIEKGEVEEGDE